MKIFAFLGLSLATDPLPEGYDFCHTACNGNEDYGGSPGKPCPDGFYPSEKDCAAYYLCWDDGQYSGKYWCAPGAVFNPITQECDWPFNLPEDHECYIPA